MPRAIVATLLSIVPLAVSSDPPASPPPRIAPPVVRFEPARRDVEGLVGENVSVSFVLVNASDHAVRLTDAECKWGSLRVDTPDGESIPACKIRGGLAVPLAIAAGAHVTLVDGFDGRLACEPGTREECWVRAWIDDASEPLEATIRWQRHPVDAVHGDSPNLGEIEPRGTVERRFVLESEELGRVEVRGVAIPLGSTSDERLAAALDVHGRDVTPPAADRTRYEIVLRVDAARLPYGERCIQIEASLGRARLPKVEFNVRWKCRAPFEFLVDGKTVATAALLGHVDRSAGPLRRIALHSRDERVPVHVRAARFETRRGGTSFTVVVGASRVGDTALELVPDTEPTARLFAGDLVLETDDPRAPETRLALSGIWRSAAVPPGNH